MNSHWVFHKIIPAWKKCVLFFLHLGIIQLHIFFDMKTIPYSKWMKKFSVLYLQLAVLLACGCTCSYVNAQNSINASGGEAAGSGGTSSYSVGQICYYMFTGSGGASAEGVQQPIELFPGGNVEMPDEVIINTYPNPTGGEVLVHIPEPVAENTGYYIYNIQGMLVKSGMLTSGLTSLCFASLPSAVYILHISVDNNNTYICKIIKK
jgi:hypothetical protein